MNPLKVTEDTALQLMLNMKVKFGGTIRTKSHHEDDQFGKSSRHNVTLDIGNDGVFFTVIRNDMEFEDAQDNVHIELLYQHECNRIYPNTDMSYIKEVFGYLMEIIGDDGYDLDGLMPEL